MGTISYSMHNVQVNKDATVILSLRFLIFRVQCDILESLRNKSCTPSSASSSQDHDAVAR